MVFSVEMAALGKRLGAMRRVLGAPLFLAWEEVMPARSRRPVCQS